MSWCLQSGVLTKFPFDPLGLDSEANREKEVKNGRLAMVSLCTRDTGAGVYCSCLEHITCHTLAATPPMVLHARV